MSIPFFLRAGCLGLFLTLGLAPAWAQQAMGLTLPALGGGVELSLSAERELGERIARELYRDPDYIDDPVLTEYVQGIWQPLLAAARARGDLPPELAERFAWQVLMGRDRAVNAFALPGGYFGLQLGLIGVTTRRDELASVLAHELTHVTQRHIARSMAEQDKMAPWVIGSMILAGLAASKSPGAAQALAVGGQAVAAQKQLNYSRDMEREADRLGFGVLTGAGFDGRGFVSMFEKLQHTQRLNDNGSYPYLRSHPLTTERVADMQSRVGLGGASDAARTSKSIAGGAVTTAQTAENDDFLHALMAARARVLGQPGVDVLRGWAAEADVPALASWPLVRRLAVLYAAALAQAQLGDWTKAQALAAQLATAVAGQPDLARQARLLQAELALERGDAVRATQLLGAANAARFQGLSPAALRGASSAGAGSVSAGKPGLTTPGGLNLNLPAPPGDSASALPGMVQPGRPEMLLLANARVRVQTGGAGQAGLRPDTVATAAALSVSRAGGAAGGLAQSAEALQAWVADEPLDASAWQVLAGVRQALGQPLRALRAEAEAHAARLDDAAAVDRLKAGQDLARQQAGLGQPVDEIDAAIIDSRLKLMTSRVRQQALQR